MMDSSDLRLAEKFKAALIERGVPLERLIVFGSRARGDHEPFSDMDVCVIVTDDSSDTRAQIRDVAWEVGFEADVLISSIIFTASQLEGRPYCELPVVEAVQEEGVVV